MRLKFFVRESNPRKMKRTGIKEICSPNSTRWVELFESPFDCSDDDDEVKRIVIDFSKAKMIKNNILLKVEMFSLESKFDFEDEDLEDEDQD